MNSPEHCLSAFPWPRREGNKYDRGHAVVMGGPVHSAGAAKLAARAALRAGAGLVSVACDQASLPIYAASFSAIMTKPVETLEDFAKLLEDFRINAVLIGPGAGVTAKTKAFVEIALKAKKSLVLDADGLNVFAEHPEELFKRIQSPTILTPHEGEFARLFGSRISSDLPREKRALKAAKLSGAVIVLKGFNSIIASPDGRIVTNENATPWLATAGTGDVLAGICLGLIAQKMPAFEAACAAVWMHAESASRFGPGLIAEDIAKRLPALLKELQPS